MLQGEHSAILSTFIKLPFVIKIFVLSIFEWPFKTVFSVHVFIVCLFDLILYVPSTFFSYIGTGLAGLNQFLAIGGMFLLKDT